MQKYVDGALVDLTPAEEQQVLADQQASAAIKSPVPEEISDRQFGVGLWHLNLISFEDCENFVATGAIPAPLQALINQLPDDDTGQPTPRKEATIFIKGAKSYMRSHPLTDEIGAAYGWDKATLDDHWRTWSAL